MPNITSIMGIADNPPDIEGPRFSTQRFALLRCRPTVGLSNSMVAYHPVCERSRSDALGEDPLADRADVAHVVREVVQGCEARVQDLFREVEMSQVRAGVRATRRARTGRIDRAQIQAVRRVRDVD